MLQASLPMLSCGLWHRFALKKRGFCFEGVEFFKPIFVSKAFNIALCLRVMMCVIRSLLGVTQLHLFAANCYGLSLQLHVLVFGNVTCNRVTPLSARHRTAGDPVIQTLDLTRGPYITLA